MTSPVLDGAPPIPRPTGSVSCGSSAGYRTASKMGRRRGRSRPCSALCAVLPMDCRTSAPSPFSRSCTTPATPGSAVAPGVRRGWVALRKRKYGVDRVEDPHTAPKKELIERAYRGAEALGLQVWGEDEAGPYQPIPHPGESWQPTGHPARQPHEYVRGGTAKLLTLFRPATGAVRGEPVDQTPNAILHPWLKRELAAILASCPA